MAALVPERLLGPASTPILAAGYEGFTGAAWQDLAATAPNTAEYMTLLFRMFGIYGVALSLLAIATAANGFRRGGRWAWWRCWLATRSRSPRRWRTTRSCELSDRSNCRNTSASPRSTGLLLTAPSRVG
jgi:hypothetical protein